MNNRVCVQRSEEKTAGETYTVKEFINLRLELGVGVVRCSCCGSPPPSPSPSSCHTPQQYDKKRVKIDQGLDFLKFWQGKPRKTVGKTRENEEKTVTITNFRVYFSY